MNYVISPSFLNIHLHVRSMKLMLRPEWRLWPFSSFLGVLDLKTGVTIALLFAVRRCLFFFSFFSKFTDTFPSVTGFQQGRGCVWSHCRSDWGRWLFCTTESLHILCSGSRRVDLGSPCDTGSTFISHSTDIPFISYCFRKMQKRHYISLIYFLPTISFPPHGPSFSPLFGGYGHLTTDAAKRILLLSKL